MFFPLLHLQWFFSAGVASDAMHVAQSVVARCQLSHFAEFSAHSGAGLQRL